MKRRRGCLDHLDTLAVELIDGGKLSNSPLAIPGLSGARGAVVAEGTLAAVVGTVVVPYFGGL